MRITSIPTAYRNVNRATEIVRVLSKYGLADWISRFNFDFAKGLLRDNEGEALATQTRENRIRMALQDLGPTFIKLGQLLSTRPELVGRSLADELRRLQDGAPADDATTIRDTIVQELGQPIEQLFLRFEDEPIAAASIGQVHRAVLHSGQRVVVKIQRHGIADIVRRDIDVMMWLAEYADKIPEFAPYRPSATLAEMQRTLLRELDFGREERNLQTFASRFADNPRIEIPDPISEYCTPRVLTMEWIDAIKLTATDRIADQQFDLEVVARNGANIYLEMIFVDGFYHADPHPGNIALLPGNVIVLFDFGNVGRIDEELREDIEEVMLSMVQRDPIHLANVLKRIGHTPPDLDETAFRTDLADYVSHFGTQSLEAFDVGGALAGMTEMIHRYRITLPPQVSVLIKTLVTLEGTAKLLHPNFSMMEVMRPFQKRAMLRRMSPARRVKKIRRAYMEFEHLASVLPRKIMSLVDQLQSGEYDVNLEHRGLGPSVNRLVLGMMASALFLGSALMLSQRVPPLLFAAPSGFLGIHDISLLGILGCATSLLLGLRLLRAIGKSGHLDRRD